MVSLKREVLENIGLANNEIKVYVTLMGLGSAPAGRITENSGIHRRNVYDAIERLVQKGLVGYVTEDGIKRFQVTGPERLLELISKRKREIEDNEKELESLMPKLLLEKASRKEKQDVSILRGRDCRKIVFEDILRSTKENCVLGGHTPSKMFINYVKQWNRRRAKLGIKDKLIYNRPDSFSDFLNNLPNTEVRLMSKGIDSKTVFNIYGDKVAIFMWVDNQPVTIWINNDKVANDFREYFNVMWDDAKRIKK